MKIQLTQNDINQMVYESVKKVIANKTLNEDGEGTGFRNVRKIIIGNILAKHPGFHYNNEIAWAYYVLNHQHTREGQNNDIPAELYDKVRKGLEEDKVIAANIESEKKARIAAYEEWASNPSNYEGIEFNFEPADIDESDEEAIQEEFKRLHDTEREYSEKQRNFKADVTLTRDTDGQEFHTQFRAPYDLKNYRKISDKLYDALFKVQSEYGDNHFEEVLSFCANAESYPSREFQKRADMMKAEENEGRVITRSAFGPSNHRSGWHEEYIPKYKLLYTWDDSD